MRHLELGRIVAIVTWSSLPTIALAQTSNASPPGETSELLPADRREIADQEHLSSWTVKKIPPQPFMNEIYWQVPDDTPAFFRDSLVQFVARTYDLTRNNADGTRSQAWAAGGWVAFRSGLIDDVFGMHAAYYTSQKLFAPPDEGGTRLLAPGQNSIGTLGQIYGRAQFGDQEFRGGYQLVDTPLINPQDNRMVPNTFGGITLDSLPDKDRNYDYALGYLWNVKQRDSNDFIPMSDALAGDDAINHGAAFGMVRWRPVSGLSTVFMDYQIQDYLNSGFAQAEYDFKQPKGVPNWIVGANVITQQSVGANLLTGNAFMTHQASAKLQMVYSGWTLFVAGSFTGNESNIFSPFGTKPNYTDMQQSSFDNAGEKAVGGSVAYDLGYSLGLSGVSAGAWYTRGWDAINPATQLGIPDRRELDVWLQYRPTEGPLKGFRLKTQYSSLWQQGNVSDPQSEFRFIVDYTVLFRPPLNR
jgi:outer membrane porin, OprD family